MQALYAQIVVPALIIVPIAVAVIKRKYWGKPEKAILVFLIISGVTSCIGTYLSSHGRNNLPMLHLYTVLEYISITAFFYHATDNKKERQVLLAGWIAIPLLAIANILYLDSVYRYNQIPRSIAAIIILILCIRFMMKNLSFSATPASFFSFSTVVALLLYFSGSLTLFAVSDYILANRAVNMLIWNTHATFVLIMYLIISVAYYKTGSEK